LSVSLPSLVLYRQYEMMKFFNIHYECSDARDDYSKLLKQTKLVVFFLTGSVQMTMITLIIMIIMMVLILWYMKSMMQINTLLLAKRVSKKYLWPQKITAFPFWEDMAEAKCNVAQEDIGIMV